MPSYSNLYLTQPQRLLIFLLNVVASLVTNFLVFGVFLPELSNKSLWMLAAFLNLGLGNTLITPFFVKPSDAISYGLTAFVAVISVLNWSAWALLTKLLFSASISYSLLITSVSFGSITLQAFSSESLREYSDKLRQIADLIGKPQIAFTLAFVFFVRAFNYDSERTIFLLLGYWLVIFIVRPFHLIISVIGFFKLRKVTGVIDEVGEVAAFQHPDIILVRQKKQDAVVHGAILLVNDHIEGPKIAKALDYVGRSEDRYLRLMVLCRVSRVQSHSGLRQIRPNVVIEISLDLAHTLIVAEDVPLLNRNILGIVATQSNIEKIVFEVVKDETIEEGAIIQTMIKDTPVIYQVIGGITKEEIIERRNSYGFITAQARKIGKWHETEGRFENVPWLPSLNTAIMAPSADSIPLEQKAIGHFPRTTYGIHIKDYDALVTHNLAILGILGVGKTMLALEIIERIAQGETKIICLDVTNQYAEHLEPYFNKDTLQASLESIAKAGQTDAKQWKDHPSDGGSINNLKAAIFDDIKAFLASNKEKVRIYNPAAMFATKQLYEPKSYNTGREWVRSANVYTVSPVEITRVITEVCLELLSHEMSAKAKVCLVYEEAHSLIPEWNSVIDENDRYNTLGTAKAILQGRKFGLGCMLITQRTANVTKTILNQCNSIFAMRSFDHTGIEFLSNYIGSDYSSIVSSLPERHAVFFGKSSSCENPVLIKLNDRAEFLKKIRKPVPPRLPRRKAAST